MLRIGFDAKRYFFNQTGLGNYSRTLIDSLGQYFPENEYLLYSPKKPTISTQNKQNTIITPQSWGKQVPSLWRTFRLGRQIEKDKLNIYHGLSQELPYDIHKSKARKIVTIHDLIYLRYPQAYSYFDRKIHTAKLKFACKHADGIIAISEQTKQDIIYYCNTPSEKIHVIYQAVNPLFAKAFFSDTEKSNILQKYNLSFPYLLYVGAITYRKNVISLVKAFPLLPKELHIVLVGRGDKEREIQAFAQQNGFANRLHILSNVPTADLPVIYQSASAFVYPSLLEGFGLPIVEAQLSGVPVIVGEDGCFPEAAGEGAVYINQREPDSIAEAVVRVLNDSALKRDLIVKGKENARLFSEERQAKEVMGYYEI